MSGFCLLEYVCQPTLTLLQYLTETLNLSHQHPSVVDSINYRKQETSSTEVYISDTWKLQTAGWTVLGRH